MKSLSESHGFCDDKRRLASPASFSSVAVTCSVISRRKSAYQHERSISQLLTTWKPVWWPLNHTRSPHSPFPDHNPTCPPKGSCYSGFRDHFLTFLCSYAAFVYGAMCTQSSLFLPGFKLYIKETLLFINGIGVTPMFWLLGTRPLWMFLGCLVPGYVSFSRWPGWIYWITGIWIFSSSTQPLSHVWLWDPTYYSPPGSSVHGLSQARLLE